MIFHVILDQAEDGKVLAECPALPGCVSRGDDEREACERIKLAIREWIVRRDRDATETRGKQPGQGKVMVAV